MNARQAARPVSERYPFTTFPSGWYAVAFSHELAPGAVQARHYFGRELVVFRTEAGEPAVLDAFCPHLGAHLAHGGRVEQGALRCPMHGFRFDGAGRCLSSPYGAKVPPTARAGAWPVLERNGFVLVWHDPVGDAPSWEVPEIDGHGFGPSLHRSIRLASHPQETTENTVDVGHFAEVHGYRDLETRSELRLEGASLSISYAMTRDSPFGPGRPVRGLFDISAWGLGASFVELRLSGTSLHTHVFVFATPIDGESCEMRASLRLDDALRPSSLHWALGLLPRALAVRLVHRLAFEAFLGDLQQDFRIWGHKRYLDPPALAQGDGPVGRYRQWARQFYGAA